MEEAMGLGRRMLVAVWVLVVAGRAAPPRNPPRIPPQIIVAFGDSLTAGRGVAAGESYPDDLQTLMQRAGYRYRVVNAGVSGDTSSDGRARLAAVERQRPAWVLLEFGGNDGLRGLPVATTRANLRAMIVGLEQAGARVLLVGMSLPPNYGESYIQAFQGVFRDVARQERVPLLPFLYQDLVPRLRQEPGLLQADGIHATAAGNRVVAATVWRYLRPRLEQGH